METNEKIGLSFVFVKACYGDVKLNYRFRIRPVLVGPVRHFQLRVSLAGDPEGDCIPAHRSAFATCVSLQPSHASADDAQQELTGLLAWLAQRHR